MSNGPESSVTTEHDKEKLPTSVHFMCGWPLVLVLIGGLIGGALGGIAYVINMTIYKSDMPNAAKIALNVVTGLSAIFLWLAVSVGLVALTQ